MVLHWLYSRINKEIIKKTSPGPCPPDPSVSRSGALQMLRYGLCSEFVLYGISVSIYKYFSSRIENIFNFYSHHFPCLEVSGSFQDTFRGICGFWFFVSGGVWGLFLLLFWVFSGMTCWFSSDLYKTSKATVLVQGSHLVSLHTARSTDLVSLMKNKEWWTYSDCNFPLWMLSAD